MVTVHAVEASAGDINIQLKADATAEELSRRLERSKTFQIGMRYCHMKRGVGTVVDIVEDGELGPGVRVLRFSSGETHRYAPSSQHKLIPIVENAAQEAPQTLFNMLGAYALSRSLTIS